MARMILARLPNRSTTLSMTGSGSRGMRASSRWPLGWTGSSRSPTPSGRCRTSATAFRSSSSLGVESGQAAHRLLEVPVVLLVEVVDDHQPALVLHPGQHLLELQAHQAAVDAELDDVGLDLLGDAQDHLGALQQHHDVADA